MANKTINRPRIVVLASLPLIKRMLLASPLLEKLSNWAYVEIWTKQNKFLFQNEFSDTQISWQPFPEVCPWSEYPWNYPLRRLNDLAWIFRQRLQARLTMLDLPGSYWREPALRFLRPFARVLVKLGLEEALESVLRRVALKKFRSEEATMRLRQSKPNLVIAMAPHFFADPVIMAVARRAGLPVLSFIASWDNLTTKNRMLIMADGYLLWSEEMKRQLVTFYPETKKLFSEIVGSPLLDTLKDNRRYWSREEFCKEMNLLPDRPILLYALGSPRFLNEEWKIPLAIAKEIKYGNLENCQLIIRSHPLFGKNDFQHMFHGFEEIIRWQDTEYEANAGGDRGERKSFLINLWVNTLRHAQVVINFASTISIDAAMCNTPVVNVNFLPDGSLAARDLMKKVYYRWEHYAPVVSLGGILLVNSVEELVDGIRSYLSNHHLHQDKRQQMVRFVAGFDDGRSSERFSEAVKCYLNL